jgi:16S rRNA (guanine527-N7)-methyltransferase
LLVDGGRAVFWKGAVDEDEARDGRYAAEKLGLAEPRVVAVEPFAGSERRTLWIFEKVAETPARFPRRPGMATKRPLSAKSS